MAKIRSLVSFTGALCMGKNEVKECSDKTTLQDLLQAGYAVEVKGKPEKPEKDVGTGESKRNKRK